jgi:hypothetical protein
MTQTYKLEGGLASIVKQAGVSVKVADTTMGDQGGVIINPLSPIDQGVPATESLFVSLFGPPSLTGSAETTELFPGQWFIVPSNANVWVNAATANHKFTAFFKNTFKVSYPPTPVPGDPSTDVPGMAAEAGTQPFPPGRVTGLTTVIPSYLYQQYTDDDDLQGFVEAQNEMQQNYVDTFNALNLPIYTGLIVSGLLLDWVARGLYGISRPSLGSGRMNLMGPLNTYGMNWLVPMWDFPQLTFPQGNWRVGTNTPDISPSVANPFDGYYWNATTFDPLVGETAPAYLPGIGGKTINSGDKILWNAKLGIYIQTVSGAVEAEFGLNEIGLYGPTNVYLTNDDLYRRIITWHFFKQDGNYSSVSFLKRRVWRFLYGIDGKHFDYLDPVKGAPHPTGVWPGSIADPDDAFIADTRQISFTFGTLRSVHIRFVLGKRNMTGGAMLNWMGCNGFEPAFGVTPPWDIGTDTTPMPTGVVPPGGIYINDIETTYEQYPPLPFMFEFKQALDLGVLEMPYQFNWTCSIG